MNFKLTQRESRAYRLALSQLRALRAWERPNFCKAYVLYPCAQFAQVHAGNAQFPPTQIERRKLRADGPIALNCPKMGA